VRREDTLRSRRAGFTGGEKTAHEKGCHYVGCSVGGERYREGIGFLGEGDRSSEGGLVER